MKVGTGRVITEQSNRTRTRLLRPVTIQLATGNTEHCDDAAGGIRKEEIFSHHNLRIADSKTQRQPGRFGLFSVT